MKTLKLMMLSAALLMCGLATGAQCAGTTLEGVRCKREAAEGMRYCIGHADQAKEKSKEDGQCRAITEGGARCKHKRDGESDYCKQHSPSVRPSKPVTQCRAMTLEGKQCSRKPVENSRYCKQHGGVEFPRSEFSM